MTEQAYDFVVYIGRFQPPTLAHFQIMRQAVKTARKGVIVLPGSANQPRTWKNPWTVQEREQMIRSGLPENISDRITVYGLRDYPTDQQWVRAVQEIVESLTKLHRLSEEGHLAIVEYEPSKVAIIGHNKDDSSYYLEMFPQWGQIQVDNIESINATDIRTALWTSQGEDDFDLKIGRNLASGLHDWIRAWMLTDDYDKIVREYNFTMQYKRFHEWPDVPYKPKYVTVDAVVVQAGHILLVRRRSEPGRGLWALPGGHVGDNERIKDAVVRELREETKLKVPLGVLQGKADITGNQHVFDAPDRSLRGRTITHAFYFELPPGPLPKVKGADDADKAKWVPLSTFAKMEPQLFEDHFMIANHFIGVDTEEI